MSFTGSPEVGRLVAEACGRNLVPVKLELGGKGAAVVFDDVDVADTAEKLAQAITFHTGQVCCDATRWLVHQSIYPPVRRRRAPSGSSRSSSATRWTRATQMGPVVSEKQRERVLGYLQRGQEEGAEVVLEGGPADVPGRDGFYVKPALLAGSLDNVAAREEIFGPVAYLASFGDEDEAVAHGQRHRLRAGQQRLDQRPGPGRTAWPRRWWPATVGSTPTTSSRTASPTPA